MSYKNQNEDTRLVEISPGYFQPPRESTLVVWEVGLATFCLGPVSKQCQYLEMKLNIHIRQKAETLIKWNHKEDEDYIQNFSQGVAERVTFSTKWSSSLTCSLTFISILDEWGGGPISFHGKFIQSFVSLVKDFISLQASPYLKIIPFYQLLHVDNFNKCFIRQCLKNYFKVTVAFLTFI